MTNITYPRWLEASGLPFYLNQKVPPYGYFVFKKLIELDLLQNVNPDIINTSLNELNPLLGLTLSDLKSQLELLETEGYIKIFWGSVPEEELFLRISIPVQTPRTPWEIPVDEGGYQGKGEAEVPYYHKPAFDPDEDDPDHDDFSRTKLDHVINWYIQCIKPDINPIVLQKLQYISRAFSFNDLQLAFQKARKNKVRSLECLMRELYSYKKH